MQRRREQPNPDRSLADPTNPNALGTWAERHFTWMVERYFSETTVFARRPWLRSFFRWCDERSIITPNEITKAILERYQKHLYTYRKVNGRPLSFATQRTRLTAIRSLFRWLSRQQVIPHNPAADLDFPRKEKRLPRAVLTATEADAVLNVPDITTPTGLRDRAILEALYSSGLRRIEVIGLSIYDLDYERGTIMVRLGKGRKDRVVPVGERALMWIDRYVRESRPKLAPAVDEKTLFLTIEGNALDPDTLSKDVGHYVHRADLAKKGSCHLFRHTMATLLLENGADVRYVQEILGHESLETTAIYTRVAIGKLKEIHTAAHPGARLHPAPDAARTTRPSRSAPVSESDALLEALEAEGDDDGEGTDSA